MNIESIEKAMLVGGLSPHDMSEYRVYLAGHYSFIASALEEILLVKPGQWLLMREDQKSDTSTDKHWEATPEGLREMQCKLRLKKIEKMISSLNSGLRVAENEVRNLI